MLLKSHISYFTRSHCSFYEHVLWSYDNTRLTVTVMRCRYRLHPFRVLIAVELLNNISVTVLFPEVSDMYNLKFHIVCHENCPTSGVTVRS